MLRTDDFRRGDVSLPSLDADDLPECCWRCVYLMTKDFSVNYADSLFYYCCAYNWPDKLTDVPPPCLTGS
ncbi:MAG: hypothetical protein JRI59_03455 [Deltaproteobacteria bacterium]|nr:hypothetical protein [Deltaproteobacteria bacterium]